MQYAIAIKNAGYHPVYGEIIKDKKYNVEDGFDFGNSTLFRKPKKTEIEKEK